LRPAASFASSAFSAWQDQVEDGNDRQRHQRDEDEAFGLRNMFEWHPLSPMAERHSRTGLRRLCHDWLNLIDPYWRIAILFAEAGGPVLVARQRMIGRIQIFIAGNTAQRSGWPRHQTTVTVTRGSARPSARCRRSAAAAPAAPAAASRNHCWSAARC